MQIFRIKNNKIDIKRCKNGEIVKYRKKYGSDNQIVMFEFGHLNNDDVYWQAEVVVLGDLSQNDYVYETSKISQDRIYEQRPFNFNGGLFDYPTGEELIRYDNAVDRYYVKLWNSGSNICPTDIHQRIRFDHKISLTALFINPPKYLFAKTKFSNTYIFEFGRITYSAVNEQSMIYSNGTYLYNVKLINQKETFIDAYDNLIELREATETERKPLVIQSKDNQDELEKKKKQNEISKKLSYSELKEFIDKGQLLYAVAESNIYIFKYAGTSQSDRVKIIKYSECLNASPNRCSFSVSKIENGSFLFTYNSLNILRKASNEEKSLFEKERAKWLKQHPEEQIQTSQSKTKKLDVESRLRPFVTKVLVSHGKDDVWRPAIFGCISESFPKYMIVGGQKYEYCILYHGHHDLLGKKFSFSDMP